jgi:hypothetical protein
LGRSSGLNELEFTSSLVTASSTEFGTDGKGGLSGANATTLDPNSFVSIVMRGLELRLSAFPSDGIIREFGIAVVGIGVGFCDPDFNQGTSSGVGEIDLTKSLNGDGDRIGVMSFLNSCFLGLEDLDASVGVWPILGVEGAVVLLDAKAERGLSCGVGAGVGLTISTVSLAASPLIFTGSLIGDIGSIVLIMGFTNLLLRLRLDCCLFSFSTTFPSAGETAGGSTNQTKVLHTYKS